MKGISSIQTSYEEIKELRSLFLSENQFQIRYDSCHWRGWSDSYVVVLDGKKIGYGAVKGKKELADRDAIFEFYLLPDFRRLQLEAFHTLILTSGVQWIEAQSNEVCLTSLLFYFGTNVVSNVILFEEGQPTSFKNPGVRFRNSLESDGLGAYCEKGQYVLEKNGVVIANGGYLTHYNIPFADVYMGVQPSYRGRGYATYMLQQVKSECRKNGLVPAARCSINNGPSKGALLKAGFDICGFMLSAKIKKEPVKIQ